MRRQVPAGLRAALDGAVKVLPTVEAAVEETKTGLLKAGTWRFGKWPE